MMNIKTSIYNAEDGAYLRWKFQFVSKVFAGDHVPIINIVQLLERAMDVDRPEIAAEWWWIIETFHVPLTQYRTEPYTLNNVITPTDLDRLMAHGADIRLRHAMFILNRGQFDTFNHMYEAGLRFHLHHITKPIDGWPVTNGRKLWYIDSSEMICAFVYAVLTGDLEKINVRSFKFMDAIDKNMLWVDVLRLHTGPLAAFNVKLVHLRKIMCCCWDRAAVYNKHTIDDDIRKFEHLFPSST